MQTDVLEVVIVAMAVGQALLCTSILAIRPYFRAVYWPLAAFLFANAVVDAGVLLTAYNPELAATAELIGLPALLLLAPTLWLYVTRIVSETPPRLLSRELLHLIPSFFGISIVICFYVLPYESRQALLVNLGNSSAGTSLADSSLLMHFLLISVFVGVFMWIIQSCIYVTLSLLALRRYRHRLKDVFASTEHIELTWLIGLTLLVGGFWFLTVASIASEILYEVSLMNGLASALFALTVVWVLGLWGLRQKPGFGQFSDSELVGLNSRNSKDTEPTSERSKYNHSGLTEELAHRTADRIERAMRDDHIYRNPNLSLHDLAKHVATSPNHVSQTLNTQLGERFFEYVNRWRVIDAKEKILESEETIQDIAVNSGFNSRSAFYKAFKRETGNTPSEYRKFIRTRVGLQ